MFNKELSEKFLKLIKNMSIEELEERARNVPDSGISPVLENISYFSFSDFLSVVDVAEQLSQEDVLLLTKRLEQKIMVEIPKEQLVGKTSKADGKFYTPKYWVAKLKDSEDVLIQTANKSLKDCQEITESLFWNALEEDEIVYITIEIRNPGIFYSNESTPVEITSYES